MSQGTVQVLDIVFSPVTMGVRALWTVLALLYIYGVIDMAFIDVTNYGIPEEYLVPMLVAVLIMGLLTAIGIRRFFHDKAATNAGYKNPFDLAYDKRYDFGTVVGFILGAAAGMYAAPAVVDAVFIGAGMWIFALVAGLCAAFFVVVVTTLIHFGLRKWVIKTKDYFIDITDTIQDAITEIKDKLDDGEVNGSVTGGTEVTDAINGVVNTAAAKNTVATPVSKAVRVK